MLSFARELWLSEGTRCDWPYFARWHYRNHRLAFVKKVILLWHGAEPVGICVFASAAASLALRTRTFGLSRPRTRTALRALNEQLWVLARLVLAPGYRGAGLASLFVRRACELCPVPWLETLTAMGRTNPIFERAGFRRVGVVTKPVRGNVDGAYAGKRPTAARSPRSRRGDPLYYLFDNRSRTHLA